MRFISVSAALALCGLLCISGAGAGTLKTLRDFKSATGFQSDATPIIAGGVIYGTTSRGGKFDDGTVYAFNPSTSAFKLLYAFEGGTDGDAPTGALTALGGLLYGATTEGGTAPCSTQTSGTIFAVNATSGSENVLYTFQGAADGSFPNGGMVASGGILYGTTFYGGTGATCADPGYGTIFQIDLATNVKTTLYSFQGGIDGSYPSGGLVLVNGVLYGTTSTCETSGGQPCAGTVFAYTISSGVEAPVHQFNCCSDGESPLAGVTAQSGILYGTTHDGGTHGAGIVFALDPATNAYTILHNFGATGDAAGPWFGSLIDNNGTLYGTTKFGGASDNGTIFSFDIGTKKETVLHSFKSNTLGDNPVAGLAFDGTTYYGTTWQPYGGLFSFVP
jgi:uncharacterized repeat protein (TIGR03803 family)